MTKPQRQLSFLHQLNDNREKPHMIVIDDARKPFTPDAATQAAADAWKDWRPLWSRAPDALSSKAAETMPRGADAHLLQEKHSPTEEVTVKQGADMQQSRRRIVDAKLWESMSKIQQDAAVEIAFAFETLGRGLGYVTSDWQRIPGARSQESAAEMHSRLLQSYMGWAKECVKRKIAHAMIVDILCFGFSCRMLDRERRMRTGIARQNLFAGLSLYCQLKGWQ